MSNNKVDLEAALRIADKQVQPWKWSTIVCQYSLLWL